MASAKATVRGLTDVENEEQISDIRNMHIFFDRYSDLLWDDSEDGFNELIGILREVAGDYFLSKWEVERRK